LIVKLLDLTGNRFGRLTAIERAANIGTATAFHCVCDCGNAVVVRGRSLRLGDTQSCGCFRAEKMAAKQTRHGGYGSPTYRSWRAMIARCTKASHHQFKDYGGRGIQIFGPWLSDYATFLTDMGERPDGTTLDRKNNDGHYAPGNCRWATRLEQNRNKRNSH